MALEIKCAYDKLVPIKELKPHPKNPNKHSSEQVDRLSKIILYQGIRRPIRVSKLSGFITAGHGLLQACRKLSEETVPVNFQDYENEDQEYADIIADNSIASWADLDLASINLEVPNLGPDFDIDLLGIKDFEIDANDKYADKDADEVPEVKDAVVKYGDIWSLGSHRLLCGNSTSKDDLEKLMNGEKADMVYTDPPYFQDSTGMGYIGKKKVLHKLEEGDLNNFDPNSLFPILRLVDSETVYLFCNKKLLRPYMEFFESEERLWDLLAMCKRNPMPSKGGNFLNDIEWLFGSRKPGAYFDDKLDYGFYYKARQINVRESEFGHPTEKQVDFISPYLRISSKPNANVLDLFLGSGSTLIACEKTNRKCFGMEIDPHYCDVIIARWEKFTGQKAVKLN